MTIGRKTNPRSDFFVISVWIGAGGQPHNTHITLTYTTSITTVMAVLIKQILSQLFNWGNNNSHDAGAPPALALSNYVNGQWTNQFSFVPPPPETTRPESRRR